MKTELHGNRDLETEQGIERETKIKVKIFFVEKSSMSVLKEERKVN